MWKVFYTRREYEVQERKLNKALLIIQTMMIYMTDPALKNVFEKAIKEINEIR